MLTEKPPLELVRTLALDVDGFVQLAPDGWVRKFSLSAPAKQVLHFDKVELLCVGWMLCTMTTRQTQPDTRSLSSSWPPSCLGQHAVFQTCIVLKETAAERLGVLLFTAAALAA